MRVAVELMGEVAGIQMEWTDDAGFFWKLRDGEFDVACYERALQKLRDLSVADPDFLPRRLVAVLWYIPLFIQWQDERILKTGVDLVTFANVMGAMTGEVERILGLP